MRGFNKSHIARLVIAYSTYFPLDSILGSLIYSYFKYAEQQDKKQKGLFLASSTAALQLHHVEMDSSDSL